MKNILLSVLFLFSLGSIFASDMVIAATLAEVNAVVERVKTTQRMLARAFKNNQNQNEIAEFLLHGMLGVRRDALVDMTLDYKRTSLKDYFSTLGFDVDDSALVGLNYHFEDFVRVVRAYKVVFLELKNIFYDTGSSIDVEKPENINRNELIELVLSSVAPFPREDLVDISLNDKKEALVIVLNSELGAAEVAPVSSGSDDSASSSSTGAVSPSGGDAAAKGGGEGDGHDAAGPPGGGGEVMIFNKVSRNGSVGFASAFSHMSLMLAGTFLPLERSKLNWPHEKVKLLDFPFIGKYGDGYPMAATIVLVENDYLVDKFRNQVPDSIKGSGGDILGVLHGIDLANISFYTDISVWIEGAITAWDAGGVVRAPAFNSKGRQFNIGFHGVADLWGYLPAGFNFATDSKNESIPMGVFDVSGATGGAPPGMIPVGSLTAIGISNHDLHYSGDSAKIKVDDDRNIVTFWSVAAKDGRAVVTFHILVNSKTYPEFTTEIMNSYQAANPDVLSTYLASKSALLPGGADKTAWEGATALMGRMYN